MLDPDFLRQVGPAMGLSVQLVVVTLVGLWVGQELDVRFGCAPWLMLLCTCLGFAVGLLGFIRGLGSTEDDESPPPSNFD